MKKILSLFVAGVLGGLVTLGGLYWVSPLQETVNHPSLAQAINYNVSKDVARTVPLSFTDAAAKAMPAVVHISAAQTKTTAQKEDKNNYPNPLEYLFGDEYSYDGPKQGTGSGVFYSSDGYIVTNNHVIEFADEVTVTTYDNRKYNAKIVGTDKRSDLAVLKVEGYNFPTLDIANSDQANVGEWVLAVGNPFDLTSTVTAGIISAKGRSINLLGGGSSIEAFIQTDAAVNPGNSGGALVDDEGQLLGINTAIASRTGSFAGYSFAIPVSLVTRIVDDIIKFGTYKRALLGVNIYDLNSDRAAKLGVSITQGVVVDQLMDGGAAQYAGIRPQDIIVAVNERSVKSVPELQEIIGRARAEEVVYLTINRKGQEMEVPVRLKNEN